MDISEDAIKKFRQEVEGYNRDSQFAAQIFYTWVRERPQGPSPSAGAICATRTAIRILMMERYAKELKEMFAKHHQEALEYAEIVMKDIAVLKEEVKHE